MRTLVIGIPLPRVSFDNYSFVSAPAFSDYARVFARSRGGGAVAVELTVDRGRIVLLPPPLNPESDRALIAQTLHGCFERCGR